jgi:small subunit ribosomal protein S5
MLHFPPNKDSPYHNQVIVRNHTSIFTEAAEQAGFDFGAEDYVPTKTDETEEAASSQQNLPLSHQELMKLYRFPLILRRITQQTGKGKIHRQFVLMVVGNGDGLVGYGQGKDEDASRAEGKVFAQAVRNMDWIERFEKRTIWTELKAAWIKDISAKVWGSRNPINVIKRRRSACCRRLSLGMRHWRWAMGLGDRVVN